ncbi:hypothetical protein B0H13DRAFT_2415817 [Mycena leptocephala]|nr:hypothetical protein B0H13DRAFT_2415817 [Mycena leptocephala]
MTQSHGDVEQRRALVRNCKKTVEARRDSRHTSIFLDIPRFLDIARSSSIFLAGFLTGLQTRPSSPMDDSLHSNASLRLVIITAASIRLGQPLPPALWSESPRVMVETVPLVVCLGLDLHSRRGRDVSQVWCDITTRIIDVILHGVALHPPRRISPSEFYCYRCPRTHRQGHRHAIFANIGRQSLPTPHRTLLPNVILHAFFAPSSSLYSCALRLPHGAHTPLALALALASCIYLAASRSPIVRRDMELCGSFSFASIIHALTRFCGLLPASFRHVDTQTTLGSVSSARLPFGAFRVLCICAEAACWGSLPPLRVRQDALAVKRARIAFLLLMRAQRDPFAPVKQLWLLPHRTSASRTRTSCISSACRTTWISMERRPGIGMQTKIEWRASMETERKCGLRLWFDTPAFTFALALLTLAFRLPLAPALGKYRCRRPPGVVRDMQASSCASTRVHSRTRSAEEARVGTGTGATHPLPHRLPRDPPPRAATRGRRSMHICYALDADVGAGVHACAYGPAPLYSYSHGPSRRGVRQHSCRRSHVLPTRIRRTHTLRI